MKGQIAVLEEQVRSARLSTKHYQERMESIGQEIETRQEERGKILEEKQDLDVQLAQAQKVQEEAESRLASIQQRISDNQTNMENSKNEIMALLNNRASIKGKLQRYDAMTEQIQIRKAEVNQKLIQMKSEEMGQDELLQARQQELSDGPAGT